MCRAHASQLWAQKEKFDKINASLILVGNGAPNFIQGFKEELNIDAPVYTDPELKVFKALNLKRGRMATFGPAGAFAHLKYFYKGFKFQEMKGDPLQQGGILAVEKDGTIKVERPNENAGDIMSADWIIERISK